jgi:hypothetical protein
MQDARIGFVAAGIVIAAIVTVSGIGVWYFYKASSSTPSASPSCRLTQDDESALVFTIRNPDVTWVTWSDVQIAMEGSPNDPETYLYVNFWWNPDQKNLTSTDGQPITQSMLQKNNTDLALLCNVTDVSGNGFVDDGDYFALMPIGRNALIAGVTYEIGLLYGGGIYMSNLLDFVAQDD